MDSSYLKILLGTEVKHQMQSSRQITPHMEMIPTEKEQTFPQPEEEGAQKKTISQKKPKKQNV